jgi:hypothetical protein
MGALHSRSRSSCDTISVTLAACVDWSTADARLDAAVTIAAATGIQEAAMLASEVGAETVSVTAATEVTADMLSLNR